MRRARRCFATVSTAASLMVGIMAMAGAARGAETTAYLVHDGQSRYRIVVDPSASPSGKHAAEEFQAHLKACTGIELPILAEVPGDGSPMIVLACGPAAERLGVNPKPEELGEQGCVIRTVTPHIVIAGTPAAGTLYGVYDFLETQLGIRWYAPGVTKTPQVKDLPLPRLDKVVRPAFLWRHTSYAWPGGDADFRARQRDNSGSGGPDNPQGIQYAFDGTAHSYFNYISPGEFFDAHPEYFSEIGGVRRKEETQLCLTNPEALEILTKRMLERMEKYPKARQHNFSQMDYYNYCQCARCMEINRRYGAMGGTQYWFVNQLAERTAKVHPDKLIGTLAYIYTEEPPKGLTMHPNVAVWLCHMFPSCDSHPIAVCPLNADYKRRAIAWSKICSHLYVWHYIVDFAHYYNPFPNFGAMAADIKFYREMGVEGIYLQGMGHGGGGGEFSLLRPYYGMKLLWDPVQDPGAILHDFLDGYYGAAWQPIQEYISLLQDKVDRDNIHMHLYTNPAQGYVTDQILEQAMGLFDKAEAAVKGDAELLERVRVARMPLTYARLFPRNGYDIQQNTLTFKGPVAPLSEAIEMMNRMQRPGFATLREMEGDPRQLAAFGTILNTPMVAPSISSPHLIVTTAPALGGRALRILHRATGQSVTAYNTTRHLMFPFCGGEETRLGSLSSLSGMFATYIVTAKTESSITMTAEFSGFRVRRTLTLSPDAPLLNVEVELTNVTDKPQPLILRDHLELDLGDLRKTRVAFTSRAGENADSDMTAVIAGLREGEYFLDRHAPNGAWTFTGTKALRVTQSFEEAPLDFAWLSAYPDDLNDLEAEIWLKPVSVDPGKSVSFTHGLEVQPPNG